MGEADAGGEPASRLPVIITLGAQPQAPGGPDRGAQMAWLEAAVREAQAPLLAFLEALGAPKDETAAMTLANAVATVLTARQIEAVARREDVRTVELNREQEVTLGR